MGVYGIEGYWQVGRLIYKVQVAVHGSGRPYAKRFNAHAFEWEYVGTDPLGAIRARGERLNVERVAALGRVYGRCVLCGATLTNEESIEAGIGPVCATKLTQDARRST
nr:DUF6011 domain-containing protein [Rhodococcus sp. HNM0563]